MPKPVDRDTVYQMKDAAYAEAERYYYTAYTKRHERKRPFLDWSEDYFVTYARLWLIMLATWDHMNGMQSAFGPEGDHTTYTAQLDHACNASFEDCLVAMYG